MTDHSSDPGETAASTGEDSGNSGLADTATVCDGPTAPDGGTVESPDSEGDGPTGADIESSLPKWDNDDRTEAVGTRWSS